MSIKKFNKTTGKWEIQGTGIASEIALLDMEGNFQSGNVEGALNESARKIKEQEIINNANTSLLQTHASVLKAHEEDIEWLKENGGGGSGGSAPTITSTFEDNTIIQKGEELVIPIFFSSPNLGDGLAYIMVDGIEIKTEPVKQGNNRINVGTLPNLKNEVSIYVKDRSGSLSNQLMWNVICGGLEVTVDFDSDADYTVDDIIVMKYNIETASDSPIYMHMTVDYTDYRLECKKGDNEFVFKNLGVGVHKVSFYVTSGVYTSPVTTFNIVIVNSTSLYVSSTFEGGEFEYGTPIPINYRISKMGNEEFTVKLILDDVVVKTLRATAGSYFWTLNDTEIGEHKIVIDVTSDYGESATVEKEFTIIQGEYTPVKVTESGLIYRLNAEGKTNNDIDRDNPVDSSGNGVKTTLHNFNYFTNGWVNDSLICDGDAYVEIDCYPWANNAIYGSTIEIQYKGLDIGIDDARIIDYTDVETPYKGFYIDLNESTMKSLANTGKVNVDKDDWTTLSFVIDRKNKFGKIFINGICSRAFSLSDTGSGVNAIREDFTHQQKIYLNSRKGLDKFGACEIKDLRIYDRVLTDDEIVLNNIAQEKNLEKQRVLYNKNYNNTTLPTIRMYGDTSKMTLETPVPMRIKYTSPNDELYGQSFDLPYCDVNWQGTSSLQYVLKNFTVRLKDENMADYEYTPYPNGVKETVYCFKCDYMESTHSRNAGLAKFVNECLYDSKNPAQLKDEKVRNTINGFPTLLYINDELQGVYNFNLDRYSTNSYGYHDDGKCLVYEVSANSDTTAGAFHKWTQETGKDRLDYYKSDFECLFPPTRASGNDNMEELIRVIEWVNDASDEDFRDNIHNYFNKEYLLRYYLYVLVVGAVDSLGKNMKLATWDGRIWYPQVYDADTTIGLDNTGFLKFDMDIEMGDPHVFNTTGSKLWQKVRVLFEKELQEQYALMRQKHFTVDNFMKYLLGQQIEQIPARYYNIDMQTKYLNYGSSYLYALHGSGEQHIRKWLRERLIYVDTLLGYNVSTSDYITLRSSKLGEVYLDIETYIPMYVRVKWRDEAGGTGVQVKRVARGEKVRFSYNMPTATDQEIIVYGGYYLKSIGDVSNLQPTTMLIANASRLTEIECHSPNLINTDLSECTKLQRIDLSDCTALGTGIGSQPILNIQNCNYLRYCNCMNTQLTAIYTMQRGGNLEEIYFPETTQVVQVTNQTHLKVLGIPYGYNDALKGTEYIDGKIWLYDWWGTGYDIDDETKTEIASNHRFQRAYKSIPVKYGTEYTMDVVRNGGYFRLYEFNSEGKKINTPVQGGIVSGGQRRVTYSPKTEDVCYINIGFYGNWTEEEGNQFRFTETSLIDTFRYCKNLANVQISNCNAIDYIQYPYSLTEDLNFDAFRYVQNLTLTNSLDRLKEMKFSGFSKLRNVTLGSMKYLEKLGFDDMLPTEETSTLKTITVSDCPLIENVSFNVSSEDYKVAFAKGGKLDMGGMQSVKTIESNYSIKGLDTILLPVSVKNVYLNTEFGDGENEIKNLWSANAIHDDGFTGIDFLEMEINNFAMSGCKYLKKAINFYLYPIDTIPKLSALEEMQGGIYLDSYIGDVRYLFKDLDFTNPEFEISLNKNIQQTDITGLFQNSIITNEIAERLLRHFPNATIWDYLFNNSTIEKDVSIPNNVVSVVDGFKDCSQLTHVRSNWNNEFEEEIVSTGCYSGCNNITHIDDEELYIDVNNHCLDYVPTAWGGYGFTKDVTSIFVVEIPSDNYTLTLTNYAHLMEVGFTSWGDGVINSGINGNNVEHTYTKAGTYIIKTQIQLGKYALSSSIAQCLTEVRQIGKNILSSERIFSLCTNVTSIDFSNLSDVDCKSFQQTFAGCTSLIRVTGLKVTNKCTSTHYMFSDCKSLTDVGDLGTWDMSNVTSTNRMFNACLINDFSGITNWNLSKCTDFTNMFANHKGSNITIDISGWTVPTTIAYTCSGMFTNTNAIVSVNVTNLVNSKCTNISSMFNWGQNLVELIGTETWDVSNITSGNMNNFLYFAKKLPSLNISGWRFNESVDIGNFIVESGIETLIANNIVCTPQQMNDLLSKTSADIYQTRNLKKVVMDEISTEMTDFSGMFANTIVEYDIKFPTWVTNVSECFKDCTNMKYVTSNWETDYSSYKDYTSSITLSVGRLNQNGTVTANNAYRMSNHIKTLDIGLKITFNTSLDTRLLGYDKNEKAIYFYDWGTNSFKGLSESGTFILKTDSVTIDASTIPEDVKSIRYCTTGNPSSYKVESATFLDTTDCYKGCTGITHIDGEEYASIKHITPLDILPVTWGGLGLDINKTMILEIDIPEDNYAYTLITRTDVCNGLVIDWGDGNIETRTTGKSSVHTYEKAGKYGLKLTNAWVAHALFTGKDKVVGVLNIPTIYTGNQSYGFNFQGFTNLTFVTSSWKPQKPINIANFFNGCTSLTTVDLSKWDTTNLSDIGSMFAGCSNLMEIKGLEFWNTENFTTIAGLLNGCKKITNVDWIASWDLTNVTSIAYAFKDCTSLVSIPPLRTSSRLTSIAQMCHTCSSLVSVGQFDTSGVLHAGGNNQGAFQNCTVLESLPEFDFSSLTIISRFLTGNNKIKNIVIKNMNSKVTLNDGYNPWSSMFIDCSALESVEGLNIDIDATNTYHGSTQDIGCIAHNCPKLTTVTLKPNTTVQVVDYKYDPPTSTIKFSSCNSLSSQSLVNIINALHDYSDEHTRTFDVGATNLAKLTDEQKAIAINKNWTLL